MERPETEFAWNGDVALAYQVIGDGPIDIVYLQGFCSNIDMNWESPHLARFLNGLAGLGRLIITDRRGWGCSDRFSPHDVPPFETLTDDLLVVLDAVGAERPVIFSSYENTSLVMLFAATHPGRCSALVLVDPWVRWTATDDFPWATDERQWEEDLTLLHDRWGTPGWDEDMARRPEGDWYTRYRRASITPGSAVAEFRLHRSTDVRAVLPSIQAPSLVLASPPSEIALGSGRYVAEHIPAARFVEIERPPGDETYWFHWYGRGPAILRETRRFLADLREEESELDRVLATVLFTDIVDSTATAAALGDAKWRELIDRHDAIARSVVARYRGEYVESTGDGMLATFDGPARAVRCAHALGEALSTLDVQIHAGAHTGEISRAEHGVAGIGVHVAARVAAMADANEVWTSSTVKDLTAGSGLIFEDAGEHELKGVPDRWHLYRVVDR